MDTDAVAVAGTDEIRFEAIGKGMNVFESDQVVEGRVKWLDTPDAVMDFVNDDDPEDVIVIARGGTTTFLVPALTAGIAGVITLQGSPESHLGIVSREFGVPCVMSVHFEKGIRTERGETIPADGVRIRMDVSRRPDGIVSVEEGAPVDDGTGPEPAAGMSDEQMAQIQVLLEKFKGEVPHGTEGHEVMIQRVTTDVLSLDDEESFQRQLTVAETNDALQYYTWNEWDALAMRATEGESGLIPRQQYEALGLLDSWLSHVPWLRVVQEEIGADGMIEIGRTAQREVGTKINLLHTFAIATSTSFGRGIALELGLHEPDWRAADVVEGMTMARRLYKGHWGGGGMLSSMRGFQAPILERSWLDRFHDDRIALADEETRKTFQRFNGSIEVAGFLTHFDNRLGLGDSGPYQLPDGRFVLVRDIFLEEDTYPWCDPDAGLPYAVTSAMFFKPGSGLKVKLLDLSTAFTEPANYLQHLDGVAVYTRERWDTPMSELKVLSLEDMADLRSRCESVTSDLYRRIAGMSDEEKIRSGAMTYSTGFVMPAIRAAGMLDRLRDEHGLYQLDPMSEQAMDRINETAFEMVPRLFLTGSWANPVPESAVS